MLRRTGHMLRVAGRWIRDLWLAFGVALLALAGLEVACRTCFKPAATVAGAVDSSQHPYAGASWWGPYQLDAGLASRRNRYDPYRGHWARPSHSDYVNVDSLGRRVTVQPAGWLDAPSKVFLLGGSTMWGVTARDSFSIPSLTAAALARHGVGPVEVVNLAQMAFNSTQEVNTLILELAHGRIPAVAVFLDGYNDIATAWKFGEPGHTYGDEAIDMQIELGRRGFWAEVGGLGRHLDLVNRLGSLLGVLRRPPPVRGGPTTICGPVAEYYRRMVGVAEGVAAAHHFKVGFFLQPVHVATHKALTEWERGLYQQRSLAPCIASIDSAMADRKDTTYFPLLDVFDDDSASVFVDRNAHVTEAGNRQIAERIAETIAPWLDGSAPTG